LGDEHRSSTKRKSGVSGPKGESGVTYHMKKTTARTASGVTNLWRLMASCVAIGVVAGLGAAAFFVLLDAGSAIFLGRVCGYHPSGPGNEPPLFAGLAGDSHHIVRWMLLIVPTVGGLVSGLITFTWAPETEGHGTDAAIEAYHFKDGVVRKRVPLVKAITSAITIGTGGSGGREGPIAQIGSGFGSILGGWLKAPPDERRILMAAGMAAGIGAIFHAPLAGALFAAEVMYRGPDQEHEVFVPAFLTSTVAYCIFAAIFGFEPLFITPGYDFSDPLMLGPYLVLAGVSALGAIAFVRMFYGVRRVFFEKLPGPLHLKPAIGGLCVGVVGFFLPEALGAGYGVVQACFSRDLPSHGTVLDLPSASAIGSLLPAGTAPAIAAAIVLALVGIAKMATTSFAIGSGGSGGVFGPAVVIGGALGGATGILCQQLFPSLPVHPGAFALVGMAGFFAGAANTPISTIIMVSEMTGNYNLLPPAMLVCILTFLLCRNYTLYEKQLSTRLDAPSKFGGMARAILQRLTVHDALAVSRHRSVVLLKEDMPMGALVHEFTKSDEVCFPVVNDAKKLCGVVDADDVRRLVTDTQIADLVIAADIARPVSRITESESLLSAINLMAKAEVRALVVVRQEDAESPIATLAHADIFEAYRRHAVG